MNIMRFIAAILVLLLCGCGNAAPDVHGGMDASQPAETAMSQIVRQPAHAPSPPPVVATPTPTPEKTPAQAMLETLTDEEKIGQLFMCAFRGEGMTAFNDHMAQVLADYRPAGIVLFSENIVTKEQVSKLIEDLNEHSNTKLFIAVDEEGGLVSRVGPLYDDRIPDAGTTASADAALERGAKIGARLKELGFTMNFAPVADISTNPANTVVAGRAFSADPETASSYVSSCVSGMIGEGILPVIKHFPGHGDTNEDSHDGMAVYTHDLNRLSTVELLPFAAGIDAGAGAVMVGHISAPYITGGNLPATFSERMITGILRGQLGFDGVVITDAMDMGAITNTYTPGEAALAAVEAGVDIILMPADLDAAYKALCNAQDNGRLSAARIDASVLRILELKLK